jgi:hypothetical protein
MPPSPSRDELRRLVAHLARFEPDQRRTKHQLSSTAGSSRYNQSGTFTYVDGSTGKAGSFLLAQNDFLRAFVPMAFSDSAKVTACKVAIKSIAGCARVSSVEGRFDAKNRVYRRRGRIGASSKAEPRIGVAAKAFMGNRRAEAMLGKVLMQDLPSPICSKESSVEDQIGFGF